MSNEIEKAVQEVSENFDAIIGSLKYQAEIKKAYYDELIISGFTEVQALEIVKAQP
jgi:hypothetical protein